MALNIAHPDADRLAAEVAAVAKEPIAEAVVIALRERLERLKKESAERQSLVDRLTEISRHCAALPDLDPRSADEILGYDENGLPT